MAKIQEVTPEQTQTKLYLTPSEAYNLSAGEGRKYSKSELEGLSSRPMTDQSYTDYSNMYDKYHKQYDTTFKNSNSRSDWENQTVEDVRRMWSK